MKTDKEKQLADGRGGGGGAKLHDSLVHYKSLNTFCSREFLLLHRKLHGERKSKEITFFVVIGIGSNVPYPPIS
jgi:hypothetical protein